MNSLTFFVLAFFVWFSALAVFLFACGSVEPS